MDPLTHLNRLLHAGVDKAFEQNQHRRGLHAAGGRRRSGPDDGWQAETGDSL